MPLRKLVLRPGINTQLSPTLEEGGWSSGNLVRFPYGVPQPIGGWVKFVQAFVTGVARALLSWAQLSGTTAVAVGTHLKLQLVEGGSVFDITPIRAALAVPAGSLATTAGSTSIAVSLSNHGCSVGDFLEFFTPSTLGGVTLYGEYVVATVPSSGALTFNAQAAATATAASTSSITVQALLPVGYADGQQAQGWGADPWGTGAWGTPRAAVTNAGAARLWSLDHWGEELLACPRFGSIYNWKPSGGTSIRAAVIPGAPTQVLLIMVGMPERHLIAFGCNVGGTFDPMLIAFSDVENYTVWTASALNSAGSYRLSAPGSGIVGALAVSQEILVFTEASVSAMRFIGLPYVYSFTTLEGDHTGLIAQNAAVTAGNGLVFWMGLRSFWTYSGAARPLPCDVWDAVFNNLNGVQSSKIVAGSNAAFSEVWWCYPSAASTENDSVVIYNYQNNTWSIGKLGRTAWIDAGILPTPTAASATGTVYSHEFGVDADGQPLGASVTTGFTDLSDGDEIAFVDQLVPDFSDQSGSVSITVDAKRFPNDPVPTTKGPFTINAATRFIAPRLRGRQINVTIASVGTGAFWRLGAMRVRIAMSGRQ